MAKKTVEEFVDRVTPGIQSAVEKSMAQQFADFNSIANSDDGFPSRGQLDQQFSLLRGDLRDNHKIELQFNDYLAKRIDGIKDILQQILDKMPEKTESKESKESTEERSKSRDGHNYLKDANKKLDTLIKAADHTKDEFANQDALLHSNDDKLDVIAKSMLSKKAFENALANMRESNNNVQPTNQGDTYDAAADRRVKRWVRKLTKEFNKSKFGKSFNKFMVSAKTAFGKIGVIVMIIKELAKRVPELIKKILNWFPYIYLLAGLIWAGLKRAWIAIQPFLSSIKDSLKTIESTIQSVNTSIYNLGNRYALLLKDFYDFLAKFGIKNTPGKFLIKLGAKTRESLSNWWNNSSTNTTSNSTSVVSGNYQYNNYTPFSNVSRSDAVSVPPIPQSQPEVEDGTRSSLGLLQFEHDNRDSQVSTSDATPMAEQPGNVVINQTNNSTVVQNNVNTREQSVNYHYGN